MNSYYLISLHKKRSHFACKLNDKNANFYLLERATNTSAVEFNSIFFIHFFIEKNIWGTRTELILFSFL